MATTAATVPRLSAPRRLYVGLALVSIAIAAAGFWPSYFGALTTGSVDRPAFIHFHAVVYVGWLALFLTQAVLAATGRVALHMKIGRLAIGYGVLVIVAGLVAAFGMFIVRVRAGAVAEAQSRLIGPLLDMLVFAPVFAAAVYYRRRPELHKRLMIVATTVLLIAAAGRMSFPPELRTPLVYAVWALPILLAMAHDFWQSRRVHFVYIAGLVALALEGPFTRRAANDTQVWLDATGWLARFVS